jgi:hypothetical protein
VTDPDCELCLAHRMTKWFYSDDECWIAECMVCDTPMVVWRPHGLPDAETEARLLDRLSAVADDVYGPGGWWKDGLRRNIPDHWHAHARPGAGFFAPR